MRPPFHNGNFFMSRGWYLYLFIHIWTFPQRRGPLKQGSTAKYIDYGILIIKSHVSSKWAISAKADDPCFTPGMFAPYKHCTLSALHQICEVAAMRYKQWKNRELRQRQRANYKRLWSHLPFIRAVLQLMVLVVIEELHQLPRNSEIIHRSAFIKYAGCLYFYIFNERCGNLGA